MTSGPKPPSTISRALSGDSSATCPGCGVQLAEFPGPAHRYIGASPACWAIFSALHNGNEPALAPGPYRDLIVDAYAIQHPGKQSEQSIQSVAVHLLTLYGILELNAGPDRALWIRQRALREGKSVRKGRFRWLDPPPVRGAITVVDIVQAPTPADRTALAERYVRSVWSAWAAVHMHQAADWYQHYVVAKSV